MAFKALAGNVASLYSSSGDGDWIEIAGGWYQFPAASPAMMTVASCAMSLGVAVNITYDDTTNGIIEIYFF